MGRNNSGQLPGVVAGGERRADKPRHEPGILRRLKLSGLHERIGQEEYLLRDRMVRLSNDERNAAIDAHDRDASAAADAEADFMPQGALDFFFLDTDLGIGAVQDDLNLVLVELQFVGQAEKQCGVFQRADFR